jgi:acetyl-CoA carboxylase biotin carboxyl carrier protein
MAKGRKGIKSEDETPAIKRLNGSRSSAGFDVVETVRGLAAVVVESSLSELVVDLPEGTITLRRGAPVAAPVVHAAPHVAPAAHAPIPFTAHAIPSVIHHEPASAPIAAPAPADNAHVVTSPFVGTFYRRPNPDSPVYCNVNDRVDKGQVLCIVEAMKLMNEIEADVGGTVVAVLAEDGAPVEYGQPLFKIMPS